MRNIFFTECKSIYFFGDIKEIFNFINESSLSIIEAFKKDFSLLNN